MLTKGVCLSIGHAVRVKKKKKKVSGECGLTKGFMITWGASVILKMLSEEGTLEEGERGTEEKTARITQEEVLTFSGKTMCRYRNE